MTVSAVSGTAVRQVFDTKISIKARDALEVGFCPALPRPIRPGEQIIKCQAQPVGDPALGKVVRPVVQHAAALAQALEVARVIVRRVMVQMRGRQHDAGGARRFQIGRAGPGTAPPSAVAPMPGRIVQPASVRPAGRSPSARAAGRSPRSARQSARIESPGSARASRSGRTSAAPAGSASQRVHIRAAMARSSSPTASA